MKQDSRAQRLKNGDRSREPLELGGFETVQTVALRTSDWFRSSVVGIRLSAKTFFEPNAE